MSAGSEEVWQPTAAEWRLAHPGDAEGLDLRPEVLDTGCHDSQRGCKCYWVLGGLWLPAEVIHQGMAHNGCQRLPAGHRGLRGGES